ncbi:MAG: rhodanese-like domain-containing protein [Chitinophagales bacterium]|nr:rhodanese-like domain-containing protein [Bacteroidota bacterium]MCB9042980.1 rhodanese-like domain-containing protein [Chitinophagales bacterium]
MFGNLFSKPYTDLGAVEFKKMLEGTPNVVLLDVRTAAEVAQGAIKGNRNIDIMSGNFNNKIDGLDKDKIYLIYCRSGARSANACRVMASKGFKNLYNLSGGYMAYPKGK